MCADNQQRSRYGAAKDLIDRFAELEEDITVYCIHDAGASGTGIYQALQEETKARGKRKVDIVNLGLEPWEALKMEIIPEEVSYKKRQSVAGYVREYTAAHFEDDGTDWDEWLQGHRVELNAMTTEHFLEWLDGK